MLTVYFYLIRNERKLNLEQDFTRIMRDKLEKNPKYNPLPNFVQDMSFIKTTAVL